MLAQYLAPMLAAILLGLMGLRWPRLDGLAYLIAGGYFGYRFVLGRTASMSWSGLILSVVMAGGCGLIGLLFWLGRPRPRRLAYHLTWGLPLAVALVSGAEGAWRVATRHDDGDRGMRTVEGNGVRLTWAPAGPGWPAKGVSLEEAVRVCRYLSEDGLRLADEPQEVWRLPTAQEVIRSLTRHGVNAGGEWDGGPSQATYRVRPDKESPLWNPLSQIIYWWTATDADTEHVYRVAYNGYVLVVPKKMSMGSCAFRAVRQVPGQQRTQPDTKANLPRVEKDVPYADGGDQQMLDLYLPGKQDFTTVVFTYGSGWHTGSRKSVTPVGEKFRSLGYACALVSHRLSPKDKFPAQIEDVTAAFTWVKKNIGSRGGDPKQIVVMGHSSGAHLSLLLASDPKYLGKHKLSPEAIAAVIGLSTPVDLEPREDKKGFGDVLMRGRGADVFGRDVAVMKDASPIQHLSKDLPQTLLIVGDKDFPMLEGDAKRFAEKAKGLGVTMPVIIAKGCNHMQVVSSLLEDKSPVQENVFAFLSKLGRKSR
jgi:acetyl esterase/lipase